MHLLIRLRRRFLFAFLLATSAVALAGCHRGPVMYKVKGTVHFKDGSVPPGSLRIVQFSPTADSPAQIRKGATGEIQPDGSFILTTRVGGDGAYAGDYAITFNFRKADFDQTAIVDPKYSLSSTSPYSKFTVDHDIDDLKLEVEPPGAVAGK